MHVNVCGSLNISLNFILGENMAKVTKLKQMEYTVSIDTREQLPYEFKDSIRTTIPLGDYSIQGFEGEFSIERKSLSDIFGTLGGGHNRFKNELMQAQDLDYFAIVIDGTLEQIQKKDFPSSYKTRMLGYVIIKQLFSISVRYKIPVFFAADRKEGKRIVKEILEAYLRSKGSNPYSKRRLKEIGTLLDNTEKCTMVHLKRNLKPKMSDTLLKTYMLYLEKEGCIRLVKKGNSTIIEVVDGFKLRRGLVE